MAYLPPPPVQDSQGSYAWLDWYRQLRNYISQQGSVPWSVIDFSGSDIVNIANRSHQNLQALQGGSTGSYYHLSQTQHTDLTDGGDSTLHYHSADRNRANHTGTQTLSTISDAGTAAGVSGLSTTVTLAKITTGGTNGSLTFTNGVLTAKTDPT